MARLNPHEARGTVTGMGEASGATTMQARNAEWFAREALERPLLTALRKTVPDGDRSHLSATVRCILNADDEGYGGELAEAALRECGRSQAFFINLRESVRPGYVSDTHKQFVTTLLQQAQSAGLFDPEDT